MLIVEKISHDLAEPVLALAINAVWISALLHGLSAVPAAKGYAAAVSKMGECPEAEEIENSAKLLVTINNQS